MSRFLSSPATNQGLAQMGGLHQMMQADLERAQREQEFNENLNQRKLEMEDLKVERERARTFETVERAKERGFQSSENQTNRDFQSQLADKQFNQQTQLEAFRHKNEMRRQKAANGYAAWLTDIEQQHQTNRELLLSKLNLASSKEDRAIRKALLDLEVQKRMHDGRVAAIQRAIEGDKSASALKSTELEKLREGLSAQQAKFVSIGSSAAKHAINEFGAQYRTQQDQAEGGFWNKASEMVDRAAVFTDLGRQKIEENYGYRAGTELNTVWRSLAQGVERAMAEAEIPPAQAAKAKAAVLEIWGPVQALSDIYQNQNLSPSDKSKMVSETTAQLKQRVLESGLDPTVVRTAINGYITNLETAAVDSDTSARGEIKARELRKAVNVLTTAAASLPSSMGDMGTVLDHAANLADGLADADELARERILMDIRGVLAPLPDDQEKAAFKTLTERTALNRSAKQRMGDLRDLDVKMTAEEGKKLKEAASLEGTITDPAAESLYSEINEINRKFMETIQQGPPDMDAEPDPQPSGAMPWSPPI